GMHRRTWVVTGVLLAAGGFSISAGAASAYFWDRSQSDVIARGVTIGGVAVGGLQAAQARTLLEARFTARLRQPVELVRAGRTFTVRPTSTGLKLDVGRMVDEALAASRSGGLYGRIRRAVLEKSLSVAIPLRASLSDPQLSLVAHRVAGVIDTPA